LRVVVTGAAGFLGRYLLLNRDLWCSGWEVLPIYRTHMTSQTTLVSLAWDNLSNEDLKGVHAVIHLAGKSTHERSENPKSAYRSANVDLTVQLFELFLQSEARIFVFVSSIKALAENPHSEVTEDSEPEPTTWYGKSKNEAEIRINQMLQEYNQRYGESDSKSLYILRPVVIFGSGNQGNLRRLFQWAQSPWPYPFGAFETRRSFLNIDNFVFVVGKILRAEIKPGIYHLADSEPVMLKEVFSMMRENCHRPLRIWNIPTWIFSFVPYRGVLNRFTSDSIIKPSKLELAIGQQLPHNTMEGLYNLAQEWKKN